MRALILLALMVIAGPAHAQLVEFYDPHPVDPTIVDGLCAIHGPHYHSYAPHDEVLYVRDGDYWTFVGDPVEFEPEPPRERPAVVHVRETYYGHHPVWWTHDPGEHYCYIDGPHSHGHRPPAHVRFERKGDAHWYVGSHPVWYETHKKKRHKRVVTYYERRSYARPVVTVAPPVGWVGVTIGLPGVRVDFGPTVHRPPPVTIIEHHHHDKPGKRWGHHKGDKDRGKKNKRGRGDD